MANPQHLAILEQGVDVWNLWRTEHPDVTPDLGEADLSGKTLCRVDFRGTQLWRANLSETNLTRANLSGAMLRLAVLAGAYLRNANLRTTVFTSADLSGADLEGASIWRTVFVNTNLSRTGGLDTLKCHGQSYLDRHTLAQSGPLPAEFLRGCGMLDWEIEAARLYQEGLTSEDARQICSQIADAYTSTRS